MRKKRRFFPRTDECAARFWTAPVPWRFSIWSGRRKSGRGLPHSKTLSRRRTPPPWFIGPRYAQKAKVLPKNRRMCRQVLDCASPLALFDLVWSAQKRQRTAAVQDALATAHPTSVVHRPTVCAKSEGSSQEPTNVPPCFGLRQSSGAFRSGLVGAKAAEDCRS